MKNAIDAKIMEMEKVMTKTEEGLRELIHAVKNELDALRTEIGSVHSDLNQTETKLVEQELEIQAMKATPVGPAMVELQGRIPIIEQNVISNNSQIDWKMRTLQNELARIRTQTSA